MDDFNDVKAQRSTAKGKVTQIAKRLTGAISTRSLVALQKTASKTAELFWQDLERAYSDFEISHDEFCNLIDSDPDLAPHEEVNGMDRVAYGDDVKAIYDNAILLYNNYMQGDSVEKEAKTVDPLKQKIGTVLARLRTVMNMVDISLTTPGEFDEATISVDREEIESLLDQLVEYQTKLFTVEYVDVTEIRNDIEFCMSMANERKRSVNIRLRQMAVRVHSPNSRHGSTKVAQTCVGAEFNAKYDLPVSSLSSMSVQDPICATAVSITSDIPSGFPLTNMQGIPNQLTFSAPHTSRPLSYGDIPMSLPASSVYMMNNHCAPSLSVQNPSVSLPVSNPTSSLYMSNSAVPVPVYPTASLHPSFSMSAHNSPQLNPIAHQSTVNFSPMNPGLSHSTLIASQNPGASFAAPPVYYTAANVLQTHPGNTLPAGYVAPVGGQHYRRDDNVKYERMCIPTFSGLNKDWPQFKVEWREIAENAYRSPVVRAKELKRAVKGTNAEYILEPIANTHPGAYEEMWNRLCKAYDNISVSVQNALVSLTKLKPVGEDDAKSLLKLIAKIESSYNMLRNVGQAQVLTMIEVDEMCDLMPASVKRDWNKAYELLPVRDQVNPFPRFMDFLGEERDRAFRIADRQGSRSIKLKTGTHGTDADRRQADDVTDRKGKKLSCIIHVDASHETAKCFSFKKMSKEDRLEALRKAKVCFRCFGPHRRQYCKEKNPCVECGLTNHHTLLCRGKSERSSDANTSETTTETEDIEPVTTKSNSARTKSLALYPIQRADVVGTHKKATIFLDDGSDACYITNKAAHRLKAKPLQKYVLDVTTTGGKETSYESQEYEVKLRTQSGKIVAVPAYGLEQITGKLTKLNMDVISKLFPGYDVECLQRPSNEVDLLIGSNLFGLHPKHEVCSAGDNLSIMRGELGLCLMGSHPALKDDVKLNTNMIKTLHETTIKTGSFLTHSLSHYEFQFPNQVYEPQCVNLATHFSKSENGTINSFILGEELSTEVNPRCGACKCGKCPVVGHDFSFKEEQELNMIRDNLTYDEIKSCWKTGYPWVIDPHTLPDNYHTALSTLRSTEKRLSRDAEWGTVYKQQLQDMLDRGASRKLTPEELKSWKGPVFYISHQAVLNPKSTTTPVRIVFNSSQVTKGISLNGALAKGPDNYLNNLVGLLLRWREGSVALLGDIRKMYNSVHLNELEVHTHRFLWRELDSSRPPDIYAVTRVNMGDKPAGTISTEALYRTAEMFQNDSPSAARFLKESSYVDDLLDSVGSKQVALMLAYEVETLLQKGGFKVKNWMFSGENIPRSGEELLNNNRQVDNAYNSTSTVDLLRNSCDKVRVLGVGWKPETDVLVYNVSLNFSKKRKGVRTEPDLQLSDIPAKVPLTLTRRIVLEQVMGIYDPLGILCPFILLAKQYLRQTWLLKLAWDDPLPSELYDKWVAFFTMMFQLQQLEYPRSLQPDGTVDNPLLVIMSDASDLAYGVVAYIRWKLSSGKYWCRLIMAKNRIAPIRKLSTPQLELNGAVLSKRCRKVLMKEMRFSFEKVIQIVDSTTVLAMINKLSHRFHVYEGVRIGEVQSATNGDMSDWAWMEGVKNIADWTTRIKPVDDIGPLSEWYNGPAVLKQPIDEWGLEYKIETNASLPGEKILKSSHACHKEEPLLDYSRYSSYKRLLWSLSRVIGAIKARSFAGGNVFIITPVILREAEMFLIKAVQRTMLIDIKKKRGKYSRLNPVLNPDSGIWEVGLRLGKHNPMFLIPGSEPQKLLDPSHFVTKLLMKQAHADGGHRGRDATLARFRQSYWTPRGSKLANKAKIDCFLCRLRDAKLLDQVMGQLPPERLIPAPAFQNVCLDLFGPYYVRGEVQKRISMKVYGVILTDTVMRAVHLEVVPGYDSDSFLLAFSRFTSIRGWPSQIFSDPGSQIVGAEKELMNAWESMNKTELLKVSSDKGLNWNFGPADSPWYQGTAESLIKSVKRSIRFAINNQRLSFSEMSSLFYEVANLLNERPIALLHASADSMINLLTPNCFLIGRATSKNPVAWKYVEGNLSLRLQLVHQLVDAFWENWVQTCSPSLMTQSKWQQRNRNIQVGDVVLVYESSAIKGQYKLGLITETIPSKDGVVRKVKLSYKNYKVDEKVTCYSGAPGVTVTRSVQRLSLLVPVDSHTDTSA